MQLQLKEYYNLTPRNFFNALKGFRKKEDTLSKERWLIARKIMFASMKPYLEQSAKETDLLQFTWEENQLKELAESDAEKIKEDIIRMENYWAEIDEKRKAKA
jgi:hypothetical protein